jgi:hypothetical protein
MIKSKLDEAKKARANPELEQQNLKRDTNQSN